MILKSEILKLRLQAMNALLFLLKGIFKKNLVPEDPITQA